MPVQRSYIALPFNLSGVFQKIISPVENILIRMYAPTHIQLYRRIIESDYQNNKFSNVSIS